ncbi:MAG TPA: nuclear transport factor 2 family protein, partial [Coriobacteriia bacterium]|nr:nuclear transport factor 2 family protein [Coriobacteriia bacterium]
MNAPARTTSDRDLALHFLEVLNTGHFEQLDDLLTEDVVIEWPQTNERIRGTANAKATFITYPGGLSNTGPDRVV